MYIVSPSARGFAVTFNGVPTGLVYAEQHQAENVAARLNGCRRWMMKRK